MTITSPNYGELNS